MSVRISLPLDRGYMESPLRLLRGAGASTQSAAGSALMVAVENGRVEAAGELLASATPGDSGGGGGSGGRAANAAICCSLRRHGALRVDCGEATFIVTHLTPFDAASRSPLQRHR